MNRNKNARRTTHTRALLVRRVLDEGQPAGRVAADLGISVRTVYKWKARYEAEKPVGLHNRQAVNDARAMRS